MMGFCKTFWDNKFIEWQFAFIDIGSSLVDVSFVISRRCDHAGVRFTLILFTVIVELAFYDNRHWDQENNKWENHNAVH